MESISLNSFVLLEHLAMLLTLSLSHWYPGSGVVLNVSIPDLCPLSFFNTRNKLLTQKLLKQGLKFAKPFLNFIDDTMI